MWQEINMEQHLGHSQSKISPNRLKSFPLVLTPYLDVTSYLHPPMYSHQCPFTIPSPHHKSLPIKHDESCCTNPPACLNLEGQSLFTCISNTCHFKAASHIWGWAKREWAPLALSRGPWALPGPLPCPAPGASLSTRRSGEALSQTSSHWNDRKTRLNSVGWKGAQRMKIQR